MESCGLIAAEVAEIIGHVRWGGHTVCECNGIIYDPMIGKPLEKDIYLQDTFENEVEARVVVEVERMEEFLKR